MLFDTTVGESARQNKMRKRKRTSDYGSYVDEDTGEVTTVQTSKQAKRAHQKSGKWYKEPTEAELRAWDREEKRQALADRAAKREENKRINAAKKAEKDRKEETLKRQMFERGKITFTQTLAKKDEDQKNLHSWFGKRPGLSKLKETAAPAVCSTSDKDKENKDEDAESGPSDAAHNHGTIADGEACLNNIKKLSQAGSDRIGDVIDDDINIDDIFDKVTTPPNNQVQIARPDQPIETSTMDQIADLIMDQDLIPDFEILEDESAGDVVPDQDQDPVPANPFKVPALPNHAQSSPKRLPLSPMSRSDVNIRNSQTSTQVSSFKSRLEKANIDTNPSTQAVRDILFGISTQDLNDDLEDLNKENDEPDVRLPTSTATSPIKSITNVSPTKNVSSDANVGRTSTDLNRSFNSNTDPTDYDSIFFELDAAEQAERRNDYNRDNDHDDNFDDDLDDATLLSLPSATQQISSARNSTASNATPIPAPDLSRTKATRRPLTKSDSFALAFDDLNDDDLLAGLNEYERTQEKSGPISTGYSVATSTFRSTSHPKKKGRVLPWERSSWNVDSAEHKTREVETADDNQTDADGDIDMGTQDTQILSSFG